MINKSKAEKETTTNKTKQKAILTSTKKTDKNASRIDGIEFCVNLQGLELAEQKKRLEVCYASVENLDKLSMPLHQAGMLMAKLQEHYAYIAQSVEYIRIHKEEIDKSQSSQYILLNQRIDRLYQEIQLLSDARGLDVDMKKIVDGLEETIHELDEKCKHRYDDVANKVLAHMQSVWGQVASLYKYRRFSEFLMPACLFIALATSCFVVASIIKQMFF